MTCKNSKNPSSPKSDSSIPFLKLEYADSTIIMEATGEPDKNYVRKVLYRYNHGERITSSRGKAIIEAAKNLPINKTLTENN